MGSKARARRSDFRKKEKQKRKLQQQALYESYKRAGTNQKSKRNTLASKRARSVKTARHVALNCGNPSCRKCGVPFNTKSFNRVKPYKTSLEKLSFVQRKHAQKRAEAKKTRQLRNERYQQKYSV